MYRFFGKLTCAALVLGVSALSCWADTVDPLHGYCAPAATQCMDNGSNSPTTLNPPSNFGFTVSPGPATGSTILIDILEPNNQPGITPVITGTDITGSATVPLFSGTPWSSGTLGAFMGISVSPDNPIGAFIPNPASPGATSLFVYQLSLSPAGGIALQSPSNPNVSPLWNFTGGIPLGSYIVAFLNEGTASAPSWVATADSGAILAVDAPPTVPEPASIVTLGFAILLGLGAYGKGIFGGQKFPK